MTDNKEDRPSSSISSSANASANVGGRGNSSSSSDPGSQVPQPANEFQDCLPCKLVGAGAMAGLAGYSLKVRSELDPARFQARRRGMLGLSLAFVGIAVYRLTR
ncbi:hypothetical protein GGI07_005087 [Coemansia sp. Benny D115]|nr:hypothetical protein GGI07_005087 [Coemansia sp. Benny D115]